MCVYIIYVYIYINVGFYITSLVLLTFLHIFHILFDLETNENTALTYC